MVFEQQNLEVFIEPGDGISGTFDLSDKSFCSFDVESILEVELGQHAPSLHIERLCATRSCSAVGFEAALEYLHRVGVGARQRGV